MGFVDGQHVLVLVEYRHVGGEFGLIGELAEVPDALAGYVGAGGGQYRAVIQTHLTGFEAGVNDLRVVRVETRDEVVGNRGGGVSAGGELLRELLGLGEHELDGVDAVLLRQRRSQQAAMRAAGGLGVLHGGFLHGGTPSRGAQLRGVTGPRRVAVGIVGGHGSTVPVGAVA